MIRGRNTDSGTMSRSIRPRPRPVIVMVPGKYHPSNRQEKNSRGMAFICIAIRGRKLGASNHFMVTYWLIEPLLYTFTPNLSVIMPAYRPACLPVCYPPCNKYCHALAS